MKGCEDFQFDVTGSIRDVYKENKYDGYNCRIFLAAVAFNGQNMAGGHTYYYEEGSNVVDSRQKDISVVPG